jgi:hypothetical protein
MKSHPREQFPLNVGRAIIGGYSGNLGRSHLTGEWRKIKEDIFKDKESLTRPGLKGLFQNWTHTSSLDLLPLREKLKPWGLVVRSLFTWLNYVPYLFVRYLPRVFRHWTCSREKIYTSHSLSSHIDTNKCCHFSDKCYTRKSSTRESRMKAGKTLEYFRIVIREKFSEEMIFNLRPS